MRAIINLDYNHALDMWECEKKLQEIRRCVCSEPLSDIEFGLLVQLGKSTGLNPFNKEIWVIKYSAKAPAQIYISRDGYRKGAQRNPEYEFHESYAVYSKDEFRVCNGEIQHSYGFANRGELIGAYCIVKRKSADKPTHVMVSMSEYYQPQGLWKTKPETMIKKVAEAQALRQNFQETLGGTYSDAELPQEPATNNIRQLQITGATQTEKLKNLLNITSIQEMPNDKPIVMPNFLEDLMFWIDESKISEERLSKALAYYNIDNIADVSGLSDAQRASFLNNLKKISEKQCEQQQ
jgi:phage recombination protein Bet